MSAIVTGLGIVCAIGNDAAGVLSSLLAERTGIAPMRYLQSTHKELPVGEVKLSDEEMKRMLGQDERAVISRTVLMGAIAIRQALEQAQVPVQGKRIAVTVGSRGIPGNAGIVRTICDQLKEWGADPFIVPAMGSHGGGTAEGNLEILTGYGITEENIGVPVCASMDVVQIGELDDGAGTPICCDRLAAEADGIVVYNKVKPHTDFKGEHESGLLKMMAIGLAKHRGCSGLHRRGFDTFAENIPKAAQVFLDKMNVVFAVGVVQNAYDEISDIRVYIDRIGKDISGEGADPNVTGRGFMPYFKDDFHTRKLMIRGLSEQSHHNACGLGLADITTRRCLNSVDWESTWINLTTNMMIDGAKIPLYQNSDYDALRVALRTCPRIDYSKARVARIRDTLSLNEFEVSEALAEELCSAEGVEILSEPYELSFDADGYLSDFV